MLNRSLPILGLVLLASGCKDEVWTQPNLDHCALNEGDRYCAELFPDRPFCIQGQGECAVGDRYGCFAEVRAECREPCGVLPPDQCMGSTETGTETGTEDTSGSDSGSDGDTTGPMVCMGDEDCGAGGTPFCEPVSGECVACDAFGAEADAACAGLDATNPLCVGGACVQCTAENPLVCDDQLLLCDGVTNSCTTCTEHAQCGSGACELAVGTCFPGDFVAHVDGDGGADYMSVVAAVNAVADGTHGVIVVHERDGADPYTGAALIAAGKTIALLAAPGESPILQGTGGNPGLRVQGAGAHLYMDGLRVAGNTGGLGLEVDGAFAWVDRSRIVQNSGGGVLAQGGAELVLRNCFVGGAVSDVDAVTVNGSMLSALYTTVGGGPVLGGRARALYCEGAATANIRNSILLSADPMPEVECPGATLTSSATEAEVNFDVAWFTSYANGNFNLTASGATTFAGVAEWRTGDPPTDINGDLRPTEDGSPDYAGADVP